MYRFSRSIYCELAPRIDRLDEGDDRAYAAARHELLKACEATVERLAADHRYFARPVKTLFADVRDLFALTEQVRVQMVIERNVDLAVQHLESLPEDVALDGRPRQCPASTRKGTPCQREPRPGHEYCPSHRHLEETFVTVAHVPEPVRDGPRSSSSTPGHAP
jgi:hypothetical protein